MGVITLCGGLGGTITGGIIAQRFVLQQQGATARTITLLEKLLAARKPRASAA